MIYELKNDYLLQKTDSFDFENPPMDPEELFINLRDTMIHYNGLGLSANQVGIPYSVFVMGNPRSPDEVLGFFNPKILETSGDSVALEEGCLSFPGLILSVPRWEEIRYRATNFENRTDSGKFSGMSSRIFQHEFSHLQGKTFLDEISKLKRDIALKKHKKKLIRELNRNPEPEVLDTTTRWF